MKSILSGAGQVASKNYWIISSASILRLSPAKALTMIGQCSKLSIVQFTCQQIIIVAITKIGNR